MLRYEAYADADPDVAWALLAQPSRWSQWSPHLRGAWNLGEPEVEVGRRGAVRLLGAVPIPAAIVAKEPGRSWTWRAVASSTWTTSSSRTPVAGRRWPSP